ncbi:hypothetical protein K239x_45800 [Planctomycetes bacterium K23_9]|uniref:Retroviral aspartyl protease n=2 Tax=Stieleria marina TaxID=1930275 RepID=A0A517NZL0_9BACT|nr:hypothetical protein K239x_45800 [Planctomycetes bacterium K23_9]
MLDASRRRFLLAAALIGLSPASASWGQNAAAAKYSDDVVKKAEQILKEAGLRRNGKSYSAINTTGVSRALSGLSRQRRQLGLVYKDWKTANGQLAALQQQLKRLNVQDGELNLQLARVAGIDVSADNRIVALINAGRIKSKLITGQIEEARKMVAAKRDSLGQSEAAYADMVMAIRKDFDAVGKNLSNSLVVPQVKIALGVMQRNFDMPAPAEITSISVLSPLEKRIAKVEQEVFSELIPLEVRNGGSLFIDVVVGNKTMRMVVDSGATLVTLPADKAAELGIQVPADAPELRLVMANGSEIAAKAVILPRVRIGEFEAHNVRAAILHASANGAEPLLGMSYLGNFKFEINTSDKTLKMLRVAAE